MQPCCPFALLPTALSGSTDPIPDVSNRLISGGVDASGWRLPADGFEAAVVQAIADHLASVRAGTMF